MDRVSEIVQIRNLTNNVKNSTLVFSFARSTEAASLLWLVSQVLLAVKTLSGGQGRYTDPAKLLIGVLVKMLDVLQT